MKVTFLESGAVRNNVARRVAALAGKRREIERVLLFGSLATDRAVPGSDADLLVILSRSDLPFLARIPLYVPEGCGIAVDVFPYTQAEVAQMRASDHPLIVRALKEGVEVYVSDEELIGRHYAGREATDELSRRYWKELHAQLHRRLFWFFRAQRVDPMDRAKNAAEQLVQQTFVKVIMAKSPWKREGGASVRTWLFRIAHNACGDFIDHEGQIQLVPGGGAATQDLIGAEPDRRAGPYEKVEASDDRRAVRECMSELPQEELVVVGLIQADFKQTQIAEILKISNATVARRKDAAYAKLKQCMERKRNEPSRRRRPAPVGGSGGAREP